jgi:NAD(P)-dependent dehydrogenase (short-subunit alcohol dehydrogenase family)
MTTPYTPNSFRAIVIGAYGGIGREVCRMIDAAHGTAFLVGRDSDALHALSNQYGWPSAIADATDWDSLETAVASADSILGGFDAVIHLAGSVLLKPMHLTSRSEWDSTLATNLTSAAGVIRSAVPKMFSRGGSIVLVSSAAGSTGLANHEAIAASKAGIEGLVRSAATTYAAKGIRINAVAPGLVQTPLTERVWNNPRSAEVSLSMHPLGRFGTPADIARAILWLSSPEQTWVTGQVLGVDGGLARLKTVATPRG